MYRLKQYLFQNFEQCIVLMILLSVLALNFFVVQKLAFLNFYYLPVLTAGYVLGKRASLLASVFCILAVSLFAIMSPTTFHNEQMVGDLEFSIAIWGGFLMLTGVCVGFLYEEKEKKVDDLRTAYVGVVEILSKYLESTDRYTENHSLRVANYSTEIAIAMELSREEVENVRVGGLLHDIGKIEVSTDLIKKAAALTAKEKKDVATHADKGGKLLASVGSVLKGAIPIVEAHHKYFGDSYNNGTIDEDVPVGARIVAVADAYDAMTSDRPYRAGMPPWQALAELEAGAGKQFDPDVVRAFKRVVFSRIETEAKASEIIADQILSKDKKLLDNPKMS